MAKFTDLEQGLIWFLLVILGIWLFYQSVQGLKYGLHLAKRRYGRWGTILTVIFASFGGPLAFFVFLGFSFFCPPSIRKSRYIDAF